MRTCTRCRRYLPATAFHRDRGRPGGYGYHCQDCHNKRMREYRARVRADRTQRVRRPVADVDQIAVDRAVAGDPPATMTPAERYEAVRRLTARGLSADRIAEMLHIVARTVQRARAATGAVPSTCTGCLGPACRWHAHRAAA
ncbi:helix-turn-helix domain-containing protein [Embleya sp. NBC_00888]|uniref:helix-turn-helix domain-containing protein n=1 Tax=Embleya sp. NBC_00888 TaxID=2975960 RepID=UPI00387070EA|nr:helix-turn-helix domain-containing protein [Embleya sp. NBC_00888]